MTAKDGSQVKKMAVPIPDGDSIRSAAFHADFKFLLVVTTTLNMAWTLPTTFDGEFALHVLLYAPYILDWMICHHGFMRYRHDEDVQEFQLAGYITHPISDRGPSEAFIVGVGPILGFYELANSRLRQDIVRLYASQINCSFGESQFNIIEILSACWRPEYHHVFCDFLKSLLAVPGTRWVPPPDMSVALNPLAKLLDAAATQPLANAAAQIVIDYCLRQAKKEQDPQFLVPIRQCLHLLVDPKQQYSEMALNIYREMAYLPSQSRDFIIGHHSLANPLEPRWAFWRHYPWGLHQYKDQVMQLETVKIPNPPKGNFTREIFQASFDMLWTKPEAEEEESQDDTEESKKNDHVRKLYSWPRTIWTMVLRKCRLKYNTTIECYPFELEALDNPALMALVEYKWNTIGFSYWLVRFLGQLCYYTLVLTAVFLQIYGENRVTDEGVLISDPGPEGLYIAIIVIAFTFLWLELGQFVKQKRDYIRSVYNLVDFGVFLLPLIGAINQILIIHGAISVGTNPAVLSFSVLLVFLHFLFELRVFQAVCHFVSIIIRAIYSIRVFIFVFSGGLLAFAIAILHLMHTCVSAEECVYFTEGFSNNLFRALSVTYFMMVIFAKDNSMKKAGILG
ncbi:MAG: hypothetical protein J3R72DRAFT_430182 [Linnemannia gamsii]|nr:MAG: hypothetical protein J3R72DRAFT_430182 [Linnemannia gamsii]